VRDRTSAILCFGLVALMFGLPAVIWAIFLPSLRRGLPNPIPPYERILLEIAVLCGRWKWLLALPVGGLGLLFTIAELTRSPQARR
jgi:hypothetical protein